MKTTLNEIRKHHPCEEGWVKLLAYLGKTKADDEPLAFISILNAVGIEDTIWCLRTQKYKDYCLFIADMAELVLPKFERKYPEDFRPRLAIQAIRDWEQGVITKANLKSAASAAAYAAYAAYANATNAAAAYAANAAAAAAAYAAAAYAANAAAANAADADADWNDIETLFIKHFGEET